ncbi:hypothetical protein ACFL6C_09260 [Myxococcota bacterium]
MGIILFTNGICRLLAPLAGAALLASGSYEAVFAAGAGLIMLSATLCVVELLRERQQPTLATMARFEDSFGDDGPPPLR